jgi:uncharacterized BrkB/YihY/UPF0761 family membrane protein
LEAKDILQINATVIAGAFIFLSLSIALIEESERQETEDEKAINQSTTRQSPGETIFRSNSQAFVALFIILPFALSSIIAIGAEFDKDKKSIDYERAMKGSLVFMIWGFFIFFIIALLVFLGLIKFIPD